VTADRRTDLKQVRSTGCASRVRLRGLLRALLGTDENGHWRIAPATPTRVSGGTTATNTLILETEWSTATGSVRVNRLHAATRRRARRRTDRGGICGTVEMRSELRLRFDYGQVVPWVRNLDGQVVAIAGPTRSRCGPTSTSTGVTSRPYADFRVSAGTGLVRAHLASVAPPGARADRALASLEPTETFWTEWIARSKGANEFGEEVTRSILTLKALTYVRPAASSRRRHLAARGAGRAAQLGLPVLLVARRNDDAGRDAAVGLHRGGPRLAELAAPGDRRVAVRLQIMYGVTGERRLREFEADWLPGFAASAPVRIGNAAADQLQIDVYGEVMDVLALAREDPDRGERRGVAVQRGLMRHLSEIWNQPDEGIWEVRGGRQHFTHSKVMAGSRSTGPRGRSSGSGWAGRPSSGGRWRTRFTGTCARRRSTSSGTPSPRRTAARRWTPPSC
jgi:GH15 family glucan-1,4-alpha-glucosidase